MKPSQPYRKTLRKVLRDPKMVVGFLNTALEEGDWDVFLLALRDLAEIKGGFSKLARETKLNREHLYRMLSKSGNPGMRNVFELIQVLGFKVTLKKQQKLDFAA